MVFSTNSDLFYIYLQHKSKKSHGLFGLGWKNQEHTVCRLIIASTLYLKQFIRPAWKIQSIVGNPYLSIGSHEFSNLSYTQGFLTAITLQIDAIIG